MLEYLNPVVAVNNEALQSLRHQGIRQITFHREDFDGIAELVGRDPVEAGALNLAYGGVRHSIGRFEFGTTRYDTDAEYGMALESNAHSADLRYTLPRHDPSAAREAGFLSAWPIPTHWTEEALSWAAAHTLRFPAPILRNATVVNGSFTSVGAAGGAWFAHETERSVPEWLLLGGLTGMCLGALTTVVGLSIASQRNSARLRREAEKLRPFRFVRR